MHNKVYSIKSISLSTCSVPSECLRLGLSFSCWSAAMRTIYVRTLFGPDRLASWLADWLGCPVWLSILGGGFGWFWRLLIVSQLPDLCGPIDSLMYADAFGASNYNSISRIETFDHRAIWIDLGDWPSRSWLASWLTVRLCGCATVWLAVSKIGS